MARIVTSQRVQVPLKGTLFSFIDPMWDSENERLGLRACTPAGYLLRVVGEPVTALGMILLLGTLAYIVYRAFLGSFAWHLCWLFSIPVSMVIVGGLLLMTSGWLAARKQFHYDDDTMTAKWIEAGQERVFPEI